VRPPRQKIPCPVCYRVVVRELAAHQIGPTGPRVVAGRGGARGRPRLNVAHQQLVQPILFTARWLEHLRRYTTFPDGIGRHLRENGLAAWVSYFDAVEPYLRFRATWGDHRRGNPRMWREEAVWQAARRVVGALLSLKPRTLRLRLEEFDHFGERIGMPSAASVSAFLETHGCEALRSWEWRRDEPLPSIRHEPAPRKLGRNLAGPGRRGVH